MIRLALNRSNYVAAAPNQKIRLMVIEEIFDAVLDINARNASDDPSRPPLTYAEVKELADQRLEDHGISPTAPTVAREANKYLENRIKALEKGKQRGGEDSR